MESDRSFLPTLLANLLPVAGIVVLGWRAVEVLLLYWIEIGALVLVYSAVSLVAAREPRLEGRSVDPPRLSIPLVSARTGSVQPVSWLPPIHYRNVEFAAGMLVWGLVFWSVLASPIVTLARGQAVERLVVHLETLWSLLTPELLLGAVGLLVGQAASARREFLLDGRYEAVSAPMVVETPGRRVVFWFFVAVLGFLAALVLTVALSSIPGVAVSVDLGLTLVFVAAKLAVEWGSFQADRGEEDGLLAQWFSVEAYDP